MTQPILLHDCALFTLDASHNPWDYFFNQEEATAQIRQEMPLEDDFVGSYTYYQYIINIIKEKHTKEGICEDFPNYIIKSNTKIDNLNCKIFWQPVYLDGFGHIHLCIEFKPQGVNGEHLLTVNQITQIKKLFNNMCKLLDKYTKSYIKKYQINAEPNKYKTASFNENFFKDNENFYSEEYLNLAKKFGYITGSAIITNREHPVFYKPCESLEIQLLTSLRIRDRVTLIDFFRNNFEAGTEGLDYVIIEDYPSAHEELTLVKIELKNTKATFRITYFFQRHTNVSELLLLDEE